MRETDSPMNIERLVNESRMLATGVGLTVMREKASFPRALAAISTVPMRTPVTTPDCDTVAMDASSVPHETRTPGTTFPSASRISTVSGRLAPAATVAIDGVTVIDSTSTSLSTALEHPTAIAHSSAPKPEVFPRTISPDANQPFLRKTLWS